MEGLAYPVLARYSGKKTETKTVTAAGTKTETKTVTRNATAATTPSQCSCSSSRATPTLRPRPTGGQPRHPPYRPSPSCIFFCVDILPVGAGPAGNPGSPHEDPGGGPGAV